MVQVFKDRDYANLICNVVFLLLACYIGNHALNSLSHAHINISKHQKEIEINNLEIREIKKYIADDKRKHEHEHKTSELVK